MSETRLEKYKKYRQSLQEFKSINEEMESVKERNARIVSDKMNTTSTLPLEEVLGKVEESKDNGPRHFFTKKNITIMVIIAVGIVLVTGLTILGIHAFGGM